jgi:hypothetical protein
LSLLPSVTQSDVVGHATAARTPAGRAVVTCCACHVDAPPAGFVEV